VCVRVCLFVCVCVFFTSYTCIRKVSRSLVGSGVFLANASIRQKDVSLRGIYIHGNLPFAILGLCNIADCVRSIITIWYSHAG